MTNRVHIPNPEAFRLRLIKARVEAGLTMQELAFPGCSMTYISRMESGERLPSQAVADGLAQRLGVSSAWLLRGREDPLVLTARRVVDAHREGQLTDELVEKLARLLADLQRAAP